MMTSTLRPSRPLVLASGSGARHLTRPDRRRIERLFNNRTQGGAAVAAALAELNKRIAQRTLPATVSEGCQAAWTNSIGEGALETFELGENYDSAANAATLEWLRSVGVEMQPALRPDGTLKRITFGSSTSARIDNSRAYHEKNIRESPRKAEAWSNFGVYLLEVEHDADAAEAAYLSALAADPLHANALGNLGNLRADQGDTGEAERLYRKCLEEQPDNHLHRRNLARLLLQTRGLEHALAILTAFEGSGGVTILADEIKRMTGNQEEP